MFDNLKDLAHIFLRGFFIVCMFCLIICFVLAPIYIIYHAFSINFIQGAVMAIIWISLLVGILTE